MVKCSPKDKIFAVADKSGRIRVWKGSKEAHSEAHWHSLPVQALEFSKDGVHLYSGGQEGAIVKWDVKSMNQVGIVPRIGTTLTQISCTFEKVISITANNTVKVFTTHLEDVSVIRYEFQITMSIITNFGHMHFNGKFHQNSEINQ